VVILNLKKQVHPKRPGLQWTAEIERSGTRVKCILDDKSDEPTEAGPWFCELGKYIPQNNNASFLLTGSSASVLTEQPS